MVDLKEINKEYLFSAILGISALILSFLIGILAGNSIGLIVVRSVISMVIFSAIGFACFFVIKRFVPEVYEIFDSTSLAVEINESDVSNEENVEEKVGETNSVEIPPVGESSKVSGLDDEFSTIENPSMSGSDSNLSDSKGNVNYSHPQGMDQQFKYEPEVAAQAIRTMMKKDGD